MANLLFELQGSDPAFVVGNYGAYRDLGTELVYEYLVPAENCHAGAILTPTRIRRPRVVGTPINPALSLSDKTIKTWSGGFSISEIDGRHLGCQLIDASVNIRWNTAEVEAQDLTDTLAAFIEASSNASGANSIASAFTTANAFMHYNETSTGS